MLKNIKRILKEVFKLQWQICNNYNQSLYHIVCENVKLDAIRSSFFYLDEIEAYKEEDDKIAFVEKLNNENKDLNIGDDNNNE